MMHLAWNGEVYQRLQQTSDSVSNARGHENNVGVLQDAWSYQASDTMLMANALRDAVVRQKAIHPQYPSSKQQQQQPQDVTIIITIMQALQQVFSRCVNAEYAYGLVTDTAVYYGRDPLGRRSLLVWQPGRMLYVL